jgi:membrane protease YdiL (CAAX protease family)
VTNDTPSSTILPDDRRKSFRTEQAVEVGVFLFLIVPSIVVSFFTVGQGNQGFVLTAVSVILHDLQLAGLVLFFLWRNSEPLGSIGWTAKDWPRQIALGILLFPVMFFGAGLTAWLFQKVGFSIPHSGMRTVLSVHRWTQAPLACLLVAVVAICEETIFRGYLLLRFAAVSRSLPCAVFLSTLVFTMGHGYEGVAGLAGVGVMGLVFALVYLRTQCLVAPIVLHFLQDFIGVLVVPLLSGGQ